jgi:predicted nucleotidyltransferase
MKGRKTMQLDLQVIPPWLDEETSALVREKAELLAQRHPDVLAIILYGSVARHEERPLGGGPDPSDVDLLVVLNGNREAVRSQILALVHTAGLAEDRHLGAPREVKVMFSSRTSQEWDPDFIANVKRDGRILYQRGELPAPFTA